jgi:hypothetical protein
MRGCTLPLGRTLSWAKRRFQERPQRGIIFHTPTTKREDKRRLKTLK